MFLHGLYSISVEGRAFMMTQVKTTSKFYQSQQL